MSLFDFRNFLSPFLGAVGSALKPVLGVLQWLVGMDTNVDTYGAELNPSLDYTGWVGEEVWTVAGGVASGNGANGNGAEIKLDYAGIIDIGTNYSITFEIANYVSGSVLLNLPFVSTLSADGDGVFTVTGEATSSFAKFIPTSFNGDLTLFSVREVIPNADYGTIIDDLDIVNPEPEVRGVNCLVSSGAQTWTMNTMPPGTAIGNAGTAVGTAVSGAINWTAGTISHVTVAGVLEFPCGDGYKLPQNVSGEDAPRYVISMTTTWGTSDDIGSWNTAKGQTPILWGDDVTGVFDLGFIPDTNTDIEIHLRLREFPVHVEANGVYDGESNRFWFGTHAAAEAINVYWGNYAIPLPNSGYVRMGLNVIKVLGTTRRVYLNGTFIDDFEGATWGTLTDNWYLMGRNRPDTASFDQPSEEGMERCRVWQSNVLIRDVIPTNDGRCVNLLDGTIYEPLIPGGPHMTYLPSLDDGVLSYSEWLIAEDAKGLSSGTHTTTQVYVKSVAHAARVNLIARSYTLTDNGVVDDT
jgi:hypothetical protein